MAKIANVALTNTFNTWRTNSNIAFDRLSQFAINNSSFFANTITANVAFTSAGLATLSGRATVGTNLTVSGNTSTNKSTVTSSLTVSGNTTLGAAGKTITTTGAAAHTGTKTISTNLTVSGNTTLGAAGKTITTTGAAAHTGTKTISTNLTVSGNTSIGAALTYGGVTLTNAVTGTGKMALDTTPTIATPVLTNPTITAYLETAPAIVNSSTSQTISLASGTVLCYTLTGNCTFTMPATTSGTSFIVKLIQDGTGSRTATFTGVKYPGGTVPTITTTATTGTDILSFVCINSIWYGTFAQAFA